MNENEIKNLLIKKGLYTPDEKKAVKKMCKELGISVNLRSGCPDCWNDAVIQIAVKLGVKMNGDERPTAGGRYVCHREGVWYRRGIRVRLTADTDERIIEALRAENERAWAQYYHEAEKNAETSENEPKTDNDDKQEDTNNTGCAEE